MNPTRQRGPLLRLVCINDVYVLGNLPRLASLLQHLQTTAPVDVQLVTLAGDFVAPSLLSSIDAGRGMVDCLNAVGVTHVTFGNHEDDIPPEELSKRAREFRGCWLATNVEGFVPELPKVDVVTVRAPSGRSVRVALLGVVMDDPTIYRGVPFGAQNVLPTNATALAETERLLREERCDLVLPLTHQTIANDRLLAQAQRTPPFAVIVGGHEHEVLLEERDGTWIIKAGADAKHAAVLELEWSAERTQAGDAAPVVRDELVDLARYPVDPALQARVQAHQELVRQLETATLVRIEPGKALSSVGTRRQQTSLGGMLCSRVREVLRAEGCVLNGGAIRASRVYEQRWTFGDLEAEVPFDNEVVVVPIEGRVLRDIIAASRAQAPRETGGFLQTDECMTVDPRTHELQAIEKQPLDPGRIYQIALVRNMLEGLDRVAPLLEYAKRHPERIPPAGSGQPIKNVLVQAFAGALWKQLGSFEQIDTKKDGVIDRDELTDAIATATNEPPSAVTAGLVLRVLDTNKDGVVSPKEAQEHNEKHKPSKC